MSEPRFKRLEVWHKSMDLAVNTYLISKSCPKEEIYGIRDQMRRAAVSVPSNIAEGSGRNTLKDFNNFLYNSRGSLYELQTQLELCERLNYISNHQLNDCISQIETIGRMLNSLIQSNKNKM